MRATILPSAVILTKDHRVVVSMMAKGCIVAHCTASEVFLVFTTQPYSGQCNYDATFPYLDKRKVLQQVYSQTPILPSPHLWWVVN